MKRFVTTLAIGVFAWAIAIPAAAADFVHDGAGMFSAATVGQLNDRIGRFNAATNKQVVVVTVPSLDGKTLQQAAESAFSQYGVDGVLIFIARDDRRDIIVPDRASAQAGWFTPEVLQSIRTPMESQFRAENFDAGIAQAVDGVLGVYRQHAGSRATSAANGQNALAPYAAARAPSNGGLHLSMFWWIVILVIGFLIVRSIVRASSMRNYGPPGAPGGPVPPGGYGYGPGYGYGGGGGGFWSGLLGGLGGAWLGNEMFGNRGGAIGQSDPGQGAIGSGGAAGGWGGDGAGSGAGDGGGWQSDAGQAGMGSSSSGDWSGGGFGGGDFGGGGGDFGGGGDSGGGW